MKRFSFSKFRVASEECLLWKPSGAKKGFGEGLGWVRAAVCNPRARVCNTQQTSECKHQTYKHQTYKYQTYKRSLHLQELWSHCWGVKHLQLWSFCPRSCSIFQEMQPGAGRELGAHANHSPSLMQITTFPSHLPDSGSFSSSLEARRRIGVVIHMPSLGSFFKHDARWPRILIQVNSSFSRIGLTIQWFQEQTSTEKQKTIGAKP